MSDTISTEERPEPITLSQLFMYQLFTLLMRGCPPAIAEKLESQRREVLARVANKPIFDPEDPYQLPPFVPVIPRKVLGTDDLVGMMGYEKRAGFLGLDLAKIVETKPSPTEPYYIFNLKLVTPSSPNHVFLNLDETIALAINSPVLVKFTEKRRALEAKTAYYEKEQQPVAIAVVGTIPAPTLGFMEIDIEGMPPDHGNFHYFQ